MITALVLLLAGTAGVAVGAERASEWIIWTSIAVLLLGAYLLGGS